MRSGFVENICERSQNYAGANKHQSSVGPTRLGHIYIYIWFVFDLGIVGRGPYTHQLVQISRGLGIN